jgi:hypothetical protein
MSWRNAVYSAVVARLTADLPSGCTVKRGATAANRSYPAAIILASGHQVESEDNFFTYYSLDVPVECHVQADTDEALEEAIETMYSAVIAAFAADRTLAGTVIDLCEAEMGEPEGTRDSGKKPTAVFTVSFVAKVQVDRRP